MTSSDGGWSLNVIYTVSSDGASIYIMYIRHHFATIICNYFGGSKLQPCGDTCQLLKYFNYISLNPSTFIQVVGFNTLGLSHVQVFPDRVGQEWPCFFPINQWVVATWHGFQYLGNHIVILNFLNQMAKKWPRLLCLANRNVPCVSI